MSELENKPLAYPEIDENGNHNPVRLPATAESEQWELEIMAYDAEYDPYDHIAAADGLG